MSKKSVLLGSFLFVSAIYITICTTDISNNFVTENVKSQKIQWENILKYNFKDQLSFVHYEISDRIKNLKNILLSSDNSNEIIDIYKKDILEQCRPQENDGEKELDDKINSIESLIGDLKGLISELETMKISLINDKDIFDKEDYEQSNVDQNQFKMNVKQYESMKKSSNTDQISTEKPMNENNEDHNKEL